MSNTAATYWVGFLCGATTATILGSVILAAALYPTRMRKGQA